MQMTPAEELLDAISSSILDNKVQVIEDDAALVERIEKMFPFIGSKIDWDKVPGSLIEPIADEIIETKKFINKVFSSHGIDDKDCVFVIGDSSMNYALSTTAGGLYEILDPLLRMPQHTYITSSGAGWCLVFSMEGEMSFGVSPEKSTIADMLNAVASEKKPHIA